MESLVLINGISYKFDLENPIDLTIPFIPDSDGPNCFYAPKFEVSPLVAGDFIGSRESGSPVNFYNVKINPHGNGTHTECVGHISNEKVYIKDVNPIGLHYSQLITIQPKIDNNGDHIITPEQLQTISFDQNIKCLILRTLPNPIDKKSRNYSGTNPPYLLPETLQYITKLGIQHFILDLPSVDKEKDGGAMASHKTFWNYNKVIDRKKTITEMVYIPDSVEDGLFLCSINAIPFQLDAAPSKILIYPLKKKDE